MTKNRVAKLTIFLFLSSLLISFTDLPSVNKKDSEGPKEFNYLTTTIVDTIKENRTDIALQQVKLSFDSGVIDINQCHALLHSAGHASYEFSLGNWDKVLFQDTGLCSYGFEHGVEAQIVLENSIDNNKAADILQEYCRRLKVGDANAECYHGAGHAFTQQGLTILSALERCDSLIESGLPEDCYRGAFSEYVNKLRGIDGDTDAPIPGAVVKKIEITDVFNECLLLDKKYQEACVAQFTSFLYTDHDLETALLGCNYFTGWVGDTCAFKVGGTYASIYIDKTEEFVLPENLGQLSKSIRHGFARGVINQFEHHSGEHRRGDAIKWCGSLMLKDDQRYCLSNIW